MRRSPSCANTRATCSSSRATLRHVRSALREFLGDCPLTDDAVCLLSELCANAILHSGSGQADGTFTVRVQHAVNRYIRGEVEDQGSDWNGDLTISATRPHGLYLLQALASACGVEHHGRARAGHERVRQRRNARHAALDPGGGG